MLAGLARAAALQGNLGRRRQSLSQPGRGFARRFRNEARALLRGAEPAARCRSLHRRAQDEMRTALRRSTPDCRKIPASIRRRKGDGWITLTPLDAQPDPDHPQDFKAELQCDVADDRFARHGQGNRSAAALHRCAEKSDRLRDPRALGAAAAAAPLPARARHQCRAATHGELWSPA